MNEHRSGRHLSDDDLLDRLYGLADSDPADASGHLERCADCQGRWLRLQNERARIAAPGEVSASFLAGQRRRIYARLGERPRPQMRWAPALAASCLLAVGVFLYRPAPAPHPAVVSDAQLFSDVYSMEQSVEPRAAEPIHELFAAQPAHELFEDNQ
jgi:hypothetical protein